MNKMFWTVYKEWN